MKYLWTEDTGAGLHFWKLVNQYFFDSALVVETKESNQGILNALLDLKINEEDEYYIAFDYMPDNQDIRNKYRQLKEIVEKSEAKIIILDMICFEYFILAFDKLVSWTGTGKTDKIKMREDILAAIENHRIDLTKIKDQKTLQYLSVKGQLMGECWYKDCCVSDHPDNRRCGEPEVKCGDEKMRMLLNTESIYCLMESLYAGDTK